uniref:Parathyroid hormone-related protein n=1 Tax=Catharus ustulatus TaxID=91951 RepID=A0A8C3YA05_CATUS
MEGWMMDANQHLPSLTLCWFPCSRRAVSEHQLMHDKGRAVQGLKRLLWLQHALGAVHSASSREIPVPSASWDVKARSSLTVKSVFQKFNLSCVLQIYQHFHCVGTLHTI